MLNEILSKMPLKDLQFIKEVLQGLVSSYDEVLVPFYSQVGSNGNLTLQQADANRRKSKCKLYIDSIDEVLYDKIFNEIDKYKASENNVVKKRKYVKKNNKKD